MDILWSRKQLTVREVVEELRSRGGALAYTTILTIMARLYKKGLLSRRRVGRMFQYHVRVDEDEFRQRTASALAQRLVQGFDHLAIVSFVQEVDKAGPERLRELQDLVDEARTRHER